MARLRGIVAAVRDFMTGVDHRDAQRRLAAFLTVAAVLAAFTWPVLFDGRTLFNRHAGYPPTDETSVHLPIHAEVAARMESGDFPLFDPYPAFGQPLVGDTSALLFDPFMALFRGAGTVSRVLSARSIVMGAAAAFALFGFLGLFGVSAVGSAVGAAVYLSLVLRYPTAEELSIHYVVTDWAVIALYLLGLAVRRKWLPAFPLAAVATGFSGVSGHPQAVYFGIGVCVLYLAGETVAARKSDWRRVAGGGLLWLVCGLLLAGVQLVPVIVEMVRSTHVYANPVHPENDEDLVGYALTLLGPGLVVLVLNAAGRRWYERGLFAVAVLVGLTLARTPIVHLWHLVLPFFDYFKLSSKYFISPFPIVSAVGMGMGVAVAGRLPRRFRTPAVALCAACALWPVWNAPFQVIYRLQQDPEKVETLDRDCLADIRAGMPAYGRMIRLNTDALYPSQPVAAGIFDAQASSSHMGRLYSELMAAANPDRKDLLFEDSRAAALTDPESLALPFWDVAGITTLVSRDRIDVPGWTLVAARPARTCMTDESGYYVYRNSEAYPRAFVTDAVGAVQAGNEGPGRPLDKNIALPTLAGTAEIVRYEGDIIEIATDSASAAHLIVSDKWNPGWNAEVDGRPTEIRRVWHMFRSVAVPPGRHRVVMEFKPWSFCAGLAAGAAGLLLTSVWITISVLRRPSRRTKVPCPD